MQSRNSQVESVAAADTRGKHRILAELKRLEQEARFLEMQSRNSQVESVAAADTRGKHRILAELKRLEQEARFLEEELEQLEKTEKASTACKEMLSNVETRSDPLVPETNGPANPTWDRWFEGPQDSQGCRCWIL